MGWGKNNCEGIVLAMFLAGVAAAQTGDSVSPAVCAGCHPKIAETYAKTAMGRSFYRPTAANTGQNNFYHQLSDSYFTMLQRDGKFYQRRYQLDPDGKEINVLEKQIDYVLGSGNHSRAYLHRTARNTLIELPLAWYAEKGGSWAMNPGFDRPNHDGFRRAIGYDCMFCHNGYPQVPAGHEQPLAEPVYTASLPEGIDCQRCHGPGARHVQLAKTAGSTPEAIRKGIVNPAKLSEARQMEVCMQCHLETTSFPLPNSLPRYERGPFSYQPGQPLADFMLFFDHAPGTGRDDKYEIVNSVYRLRRSACFLKSKGTLSCTTCHNPHDVPRGEAAVRHYDTVCRDCHAASFDRIVASGKHGQTSGCASCHMPKRRTEDVVHVVMTDHYIQRREPPGDLLADIPERHETDGTAYHGEVVLYYPEKLTPSPENELYLAIAQVIEKSNLTAGIARLTAAIASYPPARAEYYFDLAEALRNNGQLEKSIPVYREAIRRNPKFLPGFQKLGFALRRSGHNAEAAQVLTRAVALAPDNPTTWNELGMTYRAQGKTSDAIAALLKAVSLDPDFPETHNNLGIILLEGGDRARSEAAFREAIRLQPGFAEFHSNLGNLLSSAGDLPQARRQFEASLLLRPDDAATRYNFAMVLGRMSDYAGAQRELEASLRQDPTLADAHQLLGDLLMAKGQTKAALLHYREAVRLQPESGRAQLALGTALAASGDVSGALPCLRKAAADSDPAVRDAASQALRKLHQ